MRSKYLFGDFELNPASRELLRKGVPIALRPRSLECLIYLIEHRDRAVGRDELIAAVWGRVDASDTVVAQTLLRARKALDDTGNQQLMIRTLPRFGYLWVAAVEEVAISPSQAIVDTAARITHALPFASTKYVEADVVDASDVMDGSDRRCGTAAKDLKTMSEPRGVKKFERFGFEVFVRNPFSAELRIGGSQWWCWNRA